MLSILIPIYNQDVRQLVQTLSKQCNKLNINYQILCFDDKSDEKYRNLNKELAFKININYTEMPENLGRSRIRNWLGKAAFFEYLLFLDGDSVVKSSQFIKNYISHAQPNAVIYGGRVYDKNKPKSLKKILHWKYGTTRESLKSNQRQKEPYLNFQSNNFLIPETLFKKHLFDEKVIGYGYEDLLYAFQLQKSGIPIVHLDNAIVHTGLETTNVFVKKTENAIANLVRMYKIDQTLDTRLIRWYLRLDRYRIVNIFEWLYKRYKIKIWKNLTSSNPHIALFNLYKLHLFIQLYRD
jgi:hypothetical protein